MMPGWLLWLVGIVLISVEGVLLDVFGLASVALQSGLVLTIYLGLTRELVPGSVTLAALLLPVEWAVSGPLGYYSVGLVVVFLALRLARGTVQKSWGVAGLIVSVLAVLIHGLTMVVALLVARPETSIIPSILWQLPSAAIITGVGTVTLARLLSWLEEQFSRGRQTGLLRTE